MCVTQCDPSAVVTRPRILSDITPGATNISSRDAWPHSRAVVTLTGHPPMSGLSWQSLMTWSHTCDVMGHWALTSVSPQLPHSRIIKILILSYRPTQNGSVFWQNLALWGLNWNSNVGYFLWQSQSSDVGSMSRDVRPHVTRVPRVTWHVTIVTRQANVIIIQIIILSSRLTRSPPGHRETIFKARESWWYKIQIA